MTAAQTISPADLERMLEDEAELAVIDVREEWDFARGHLLFAACAPLSRLELRVPQLVPRRTTRIVVCDQDTRLARDAAHILLDHGYDNVHVLAGGSTSWSQIGHRTFKGIYVPSKAFGELVEHACHTPSIGPEELERLIARNGDVVILDSRPFNEFQRMSIPGAANCPGGELVYRIEAAVKSLSTTIVVNCAGRTRSILGAQSLITAGIENPVYALRNGTMGWQLAGYDVARGAGNIVGVPDEAARHRAQERARHVAQCANVKTIGMRDLNAMRADPSRTTYLFDVRTIEEYQQGHLPGARFAPGGQLVQATDSYAGTLRARCVVYDSDGVRAPMTASWLAQLATLEVYLLEGTSGQDLTETGGEVVPCLIDLKDIRVRTMCAEALRNALARGDVELLDLANSNEFAEAHIPGAWFVLRRHLASHVANAQSREIVLTSPDGVLATIAALDLVTSFAGRVRTLDGGTAAWLAAGYSTVGGFERARDEPIDVWHTPSSIFGRGKPEMQEYIDWETGLREQVIREPGARFAVVPRNNE